MAVTDSSRLPIDGMFKTADSSYRPRNAQDGLEARAMA
jgi:hypothetical protein